MTQKARTITGWVLTGLAALILLGSGLMKLTGGGPEAATAMAAMGLTPTSVKVIGIIEILSTILFLIPRTGVLGTLLLAAYLGGAIVTHVEHAQPFIMPAAVEAIVWIAAALRFPELGWRLLGKTTGVSMQPAAAQRSQGKMPGLSKA